MTGASSSERKWLIAFLPSVRRTTFCDNGRTLGRWMWRVEWMGRVIWL